MGMCMQYMKWAGIPPAREDTFWTNPTVRNLIKNHFKVMVTRNNTFNGKLYGEDDAIFAWDIYNVSAPPQQCSMKLSRNLCRNSTPVKFRG